MKLTFVFMGVSGCGKSAVAETVAKQMNVPFLDGDFLHPRSNIDKMASGIALSDEDRKPWLDSLNSAIYAMQHTHKVSIIVCSALKEKYRDTLRKNNKGVHFIYLNGDYDLIAERMKLRKDHFFSPDMLKSQFEILEEPNNKCKDVSIIDISPSLDDVITASSQEIIHIMNSIH